MLENIEENLAKKIIFTGLDNGGKSSIILALKREIAKIATLTPTKMVERSSFDFLDYTIVKHDLGGQKKYLINYLQQPGKYFADTAVMIYVVDVQDFVRVEESISYFKDVLDTFHILQLNPKPIIYVFFHKAERILLEGDPETETFLEGEGRRLVKNTKKSLKEINGGRYELEFKLTTIFDLWSISSAFSEIMLKLYPQSVLLDKTLQEFAITDNLEALLLLDSHSLTLAHYYKNPDAREILRASTPYFLTLLDSWKPFKNKVDRKKMSVLLNNYNFLFLEVKESSSPLYFLAMATDHIELDKFKDYSRSILTILDR
ncbi:MAG: ADP-ribosylation factor-like protein [Promethearchaeota archaeon]